MSFKEKSAWIMALVPLVIYPAYLAVILWRADNTSLTGVFYASAMLWTIGAWVTVSIVVHIVVGIISPKDIDKKDQRDREIYRFGEYVGQSFVVIGAVAALGMSIAELHHFWIANVIYLAFVLSSLLGSVVKLVSYRRGFPQW